ncbi:UDP-glucuronosyl/UDP-glucosyltransferase [Artemisia annua]|uniref:UDP-glucuronosyl/UDP-glucosyltransferase n=1 Tax=Artemisia annua TaxID=35608 RepID=A0A2U1KHH7_ARTAN|nr:UDP-glucuronosyl/UDP-glucosyltransferase [Artemisia annua]
MEGIRLRDLPDLILATKPDDYALNFFVGAAKAADKIYTVGPQQLLLNRITKKETVKLKFNGYSLWKEEPECVQWLQSKEPDSVVYVNFGSLRYWIPGMEGIRLRDLPDLILATKPDDYALNFFVGAAKAADKIYTVGPQQLLLNRITKKETVKLKFNGYSLWKEEPECVQWLQSKEPDSVVYVNFGSLRVMSLQDLLEFGWELVNSNQYFLWIIRTNLVDGKPVVLTEELKELLFTRRGPEPPFGWWVFDSWTHGGWGSVVESLSAGVPMVCWPGSHDQRVNCRQMCKKWEVGMELEGNVKRVEV